VVLEYLHKRSSSLGFFALYFFRLQGLGRHYGPNPFWDLWSSDTFGSEDLLDLLVQKDVGEGESGSLEECDQTAAKGIGRGSAGGIG
jgi:hypothetical protein